jgi:hypothetical protein
MDQEGLQTDQNKAHVFIEEEQRFFDLSGESMIVILGHDFVLLKGNSEQPI